MQEFPIAEGSVRGIWLLAAVMALASGTVTALFATSAVAARTARFEVSPEGLRLRGDLYGRLIPAAELRVDEARRVDLNATPGLIPRTGARGMTLPGYQAGWFRLKNGEKALFYVTDRSRAVCVPTTAGYSVVVSPADPEGFLEALRSAGRVSKVS
ncbi:MAG TPA: PH domain-containing protein [Vicinamibacterales bacterium]